MVFNLNTSIPTDEKEENGSNVKIDGYSQEFQSQSITRQTQSCVKKGLTVGSLKKSIKGE